VKERTWEETLEALEGLITKRHRERLQTDSIEAMEDYLGRLGLDVGQLSVIHVAGTKGKGSTCAMAESILRSKVAPCPTARAGGPCVLRAA
jgi:folylpolyglutamate synthase